MNSARRIARRAELSDRPSFFRPFRKARKSLARREFLRRNLMAERLETRSLLAGDVFVSDFWNGARPEDVNADSHISPVDALLVINELNTSGSRTLTGNGGEPPPIDQGEGESQAQAYYDVNNDGYVSPVDALMVINALNGEGEPPLVKLQVYVVNVGTQVSELSAANIPANLTQIAKGQDYEMVVTVKDLRTGSPLGIGVAHLDVFYDKALTSVFVREARDVKFDGAIDGGTFTLSFRGQTTAPITFDPFNSVNTRNNIEDALEALTTIGAGNVFVTEEPGLRFRVHFDNALGDQDIPNTGTDQLTINASGLTGGGTGTVEQFADGVLTDSDAFKEAFRSRPGFPTNNAAFYRGEELFFAADAPDRVDDLGGSYLVTAEPFPRSNVFERELARVRMNANDAGFVFFTPSVAVLNRPAHDTGLYTTQSNEQTLVNPADIVFGPDFGFGAGVVRLEITEPVEANPDTINRAEDSAAITFNPINGTSDANVTIGQDEKNAGSHPTEPLRITAVNGVTTPNTDITLPSGSIVRFSSSTSSPSITYTPAANLTGTPAETFTYTISDTVNSDTTSVTVNLSPVNDPPVNRLNGAAISGTPTRNTNEDTAFVFNAGNSSVLSIFDLDAGAANNMQVNLQVTSGTLNAVDTAGVTIQNDNTGNVTLIGTAANINTALNGLIFTPAGNFTGNVTLTMATSDAGNTGSGPVGTDNDNITIIVDPVNDPPVNSVPVGVQSVDENVPGNVDVLTFSTGNLNAITVSDIDAGSGTIDVNLSVQNGTLTAVATAGVTIDNNGTDNITLHGSQANINTALNGLQYVPDEGFTGLDTLTVVTDDNGLTGSGGILNDTDNIQIDVVPIVRPRAKPDTQPMTEGDGPVDIDVMDNDLAHVGAFETTLLSFTQPAAGRGTVTRNENGTDNGTPGDPTDDTPAQLADDTLIYTAPDANFFGTVTFQYTINDTYVVGVNGPGPDDDSTATVTVVIAGTNDQPVAVVDPAFAMDEDATLSTSSGQSLLNNDTDLDNQYDIDGDGDIDITNTLTAELVPGSLSPAGGSLTVNSDGTFVYTPPLNHNGVTTFQYRVNDGQGQPNSLSNPVTVTINITPINDKPVGDADSYTVAEEGTLTADGLGGNPAGVLDGDNDGDPELSQPLTAVLVAGSLSPAGGTFNFNADGTFTYSPPVNFNGPVTFQYQADDGQAQNNLSDPITVTITVTPVNDAPVAVDDSYTVTEDALLNANNSAPNRRSVTFNDTDVDSATISVSFPLVDLPDNGVLNMNADGTFTYQPNLDFVGTDTFQYRAFDGSATSANIATVTITVTDANDAPVALPDSGAAYNINEDTTLNVAAPGVLGNDTDPDVGQTATLTAQLVPGSLSPAGAGTLNLSANGAVQFIPAANFFGTVTFQYQANDNQGLPNSLSNVTTVTIQVAEVNDAPNAVNDSFTAIKDFEDQVINVLANDSLAPDTNPNESLSVIGVSTTAGGPFTTSATTAQGGTVSIVGGQVLYDSPPGFESGPLDTFFYRVSDNRPGGALTDDAEVSVEVLAFVPKIVEGVVYIDGDNNGLIFGGEAFTDANSNGVYDAGEAFVDSVGGARDNNRYDAPEKRVQGVKVQLSGTDFQNNAVFFETTTDANGRYRFLGSAATQFQGMQPGTYTVTEIQPNYLTDGLETETSALASISGNDQFQISWGPQDFSGHITGLNFGERGINTSSLADSSGMIQEILASSGPNGLVISVDLEGNYVWSWAMPGWTNMLQVQLDLDADLAHATLTITDGQGTFTLRIHQDPDENDGVNSPPVGSMARFRVLGYSASGDYLIRLDGTAADFGLNLLAAAPIVGEGEAEGEAVDSQYAEAVDAVFGEGEAWA
jgi:hypothetical protein